MGGRTENKRQKGKTKGIRQLGEYEGALGERVKAGAGCRIGGRLRDGRHPSRDLRSSYVTLRVYEGIPLTQIAREVGTSVRMIEEHYAGVIANWDGKRVPAERQIRAARRANGLTVDSNPKAKGARD